MKYLVTFTNKTVLKWNLSLNNEFSKKDTNFPNFPYDIYNIYIDLL